MFYFILIIGIFILGYNIIIWRRLTKLAANETKRPTLQNSQFFSFHELIAEWKLYALGDNSWRGRRSLIIALVIFITLLVVNAYWLKFDLLLFAPLTILVLFIGQIRIGRTLHRRYFEEHFPEVLSVVNASVSAGNSIHQALHRCGESIEGDLGATFNRIDRRLNLGEEPERVFNDAWQNYRYREFYFFIVVMLVSIQRGGQLRILIGRLSRIINSSKNMARRKNAMTSEARMSAKIVAAIPLLFFFGMRYFSPENFDFVVNDPTGRLILYYVIISEGIGMLIIWAMLRRAV